MTTVASAIEHVETRSPEGRGAALGEAWRAVIGELITRLVEPRRADRRAEDLAAAGARLAALARRAPALRAELRGLSRAAGHTELTLAALDELVTRTSESTVIHVHTEEGPLLALAWSTPGVDPAHYRCARIGDEQLLFTIPGCLGLAGIDRRGLLMAANHLHTGVADVGLSLSAAARAALSTGAPAAARDLLLTTPRGAGLHLALTDGREYLGVEASPQQAVVIRRGPRAVHLHTNHCFDPALRRDEDVPRDSSTFARMERASTEVVQRRPHDAASMFACLAGLGAADGQVALARVGATGHMSTPSCSEALPLTEPA